VKTTFLLVYMITAFGLCVSVQAGTTLVDDDAPGDPGPGDPTVSDPLEDGSPEHPFDAIQEGIDAAVDTDTVLVLDGTYTGDGNRDLVFSGKAVTLRSQNGPEHTMIDCQGTAEEPHRAVVFSTGETRDTVVDGFTIVGGYGPRDYVHQTIKTSAGGAVYCSASSATVRNCVIRECEAHYGAAVLSYQASPAIERCTVTVTPRTMTGALQFIYGGSPIMQDCTVYDVSPDSFAIECYQGTSLLIDGGFIGGTGFYGVYCFDDGSHVTVRGVLIDTDPLAKGISCWSGGSATVQNTVVVGQGHAEAVHGYNAGSLEVDNCLFVKGSFGVMVDSADSVTVVSSTIADSTYNAVFCYQVGYVCVENSILWGSPGLHLSSSFNHDIRFSDIQDGSSYGWFDPATCLDEDPLFVPGALHDYYLSHVATGQAATSPCVDAGSDTAANLGLDELTTRQDGEPDAGVVDMGYHAPPAPYVYAITRGGDDVTVCWKARVGLPYLVEWSADLGTWDEVTVGEVSSWTDVGVVAANEKRFYRVREGEAAPSGVSSSPEDTTSGPTLTKRSRRSNGRGPDVRRRGNVRGGSGNVSRD